MKDRDYPQFESTHRQPSEESSIFSQRPPPPTLSTLLNNMARKDKEIEELQKELAIKTEKVNEFEYLIVKASEEVRRKQQEILELKNQVETLRVSSEQLPELQQQIEKLSKQQEHAANSREIQLRVELQKEKELFSSVQETYNQAKNKCDSLERQVSNLTNKNAKLEKELEERLKALNELTASEQVKNKTIDNAEAVIKRLMKEKEAFQREVEHVKALSQEQVEKVKKYKGKVKTLKGIQTKKNEAIKQLEEQVSEYEKLKTDLEQTKADLGTMMRAKMEERMERAEETQALRKECDKVREEIEAMIRENRGLIDENQSLAAELRLEKERSNELRGKILEKEAEIETLQKQVLEERSKVKSEIENFTTQASRALNLLGKSESALQQSQFAMTLPPTSGISNSTPIRGRRTHTFTNFSPLHEASHIEGETTRALSSEFSGIPVARFKSSTPLRTANRGASAATVRFSEENETRQVQTAREGGKEPEIDKKSKGEDAQQRSYSAEELKLELQFALEREEFLIKLIERVTQEGEREVKLLQEKLNEQPVLPPVVEAFLMKREEQSQRIEEMNLKYFKACKTIFELENFCSQLINFIKDASDHSNEWTKLSEQYTGLIRDQSRSSGHVATTLIQEGRNLAQICKQIEVESHRSVQHASNTIKELTDDSNNARSELNVLEIIIEDAFERAFQTAKSDRFKRLAVSDSGQTLQKKLKELLNYLEQKVSQLTIKNEALMNQRPIQVMIPSQYSTWNPDKENESSNTQYINRSSKDLQEAYTSELSRKLEEVQHREKQKDREIVRRDQTIQELEREFDILQNKYNEIDKQLVIYRQKIRNYESQSEEVTQLRKLLVAKDQELLEKAKLIYQLKNQPPDANSSDLPSLKKQMMEKELALAEKARENEFLKRSLNQRRSSISSQMQGADFDNMTHSNNQSSISNSSQIQSFAPESRTVQFSLQEQSPLRISSRRRSEDMFPRSGRGSSERKRSKPTQRNSHDETARAKQIELKLKIELEQLRNVCAGLKEENLELLRKLHALNELVAHNQTLEADLAKESARSSMFKLSNEQPHDAELSSREQNTLFENELRGSHRGAGRLEASNQSVNALEAYKQKAKRIFKERVQELELILKVVDERIKGFAFDYGAYITHAVKPDSQDINALMKMYDQVQEVLEKNPSLKGFIREIFTNIDSLYLTFYNTSLALGNAIKEVFSNEQEPSAGLAEKFFGLQMPTFASSFKEIQLRKLDRSRPRTLDYQLDIGALVWSMDSQQLFRLIEEVGSQVRKMQIGNDEIQHRASELVRRKSLKLNEVEKSLKKFKDVFYSGFSQGGNQSSRVLEGNSQIYEMTFDIAQSIIEEAYNLLQFIQKLGKGEEKTHRSIGKRSSRSPGRRSERSSDNKRGLYYE